ncbi:MAG TPA: adenosine kinase [Planctomycetaceae bacterium]|nr:adenosine kinase [Planctomycetaceae bacterium]
MAFDVYGVGNSLVDIQAQVSDAVVAALGYPKGSMTLVDEAAQTKVLGTVAGVPIHRCAGGSAANTILGIADFGGKTAYAGKTADDDLGRFFLEDMRRIGVTIEVPPADGQTGTCVILITPDAQRTMLTHLGVSATLGPDDIDGNKIARSKYVYIEGYLFAGASTRDAALLAIAQAKAAGVKVAFTISDPFLIADHRDEFWELIRGPVDLLFCNLQEARSLTGREDAVDCAREIHRHAENVALTLGPNGSIVMHEGQVLPIEGVEVEAIDTTGAGDMYAAGLLYGITNGLSWHSAGHLASHAAARIVSQLGARLKEPFTAAEIAHLLR